MIDFAKSVFLAVCLLAATLRAAPPDFVDHGMKFGRNFPVPRPAADAGTDNSSAVSSTVRIDDNYILKPGDRLSYSIVEERRPPIELSVMASGEIDVPTVGRFKVTDLTCREVALRLKAELERTYYKRATVVVALNQSATAKLDGAANLRVYFMGAVRSQGMREFPADGTITVSKAILISGGFGDFADQRKVQLIRRQPDGKSEITVVNVGDVLKGKPGKDPLVKSEDMIRVPEKLLNF